MTGCVVLGLALAVMLLLAVVNLEPNTEEVIQAFRDEGLEVGETQQVDREGDRSFVPKTYEAQVSFTIPPQGERVGGRVFTFESQADLEQVREHCEGFEGLFSSQVYVEDKVLVLISGSVPEKDAERFGEGLREL
jgi:hypothetical protein